MSDPLLLALISDLSTRLAAVEARLVAPVVQAAAPAPAKTKAPAKAKPAAKASAPKPAEKAAAAPPAAVPAPKASAKKTTAPKAAAPKPAPKAAPPPAEPLPQNPGEFKARERETILHALMATGWNRLRAADAIGMPRRTFYRRLREHGLENPPPKTPSAPVAQPAPAAQPATGKRKGRPANA